MFEFPKDLWYQIKSYEYQLIHYPIITEIIKDVGYHAYMPYWVSLHHVKGGDNLYEYMLSYQGRWKPYFKDTDMKRLCHKLDSEARRDSLN